MWDDCTTRYNQWQHSARQEIRNKQAAVIRATNNTMPPPHTQCGCAGGAQCVSILTWWYSKWQQDYIFLNLLLLQHKQSNGCLSLLSVMPHVYRMRACQSCSSAVSAGGECWWWRPAADIADGTRPWVYWECVQNKGSVSTQYSVSEGYSHAVSPQDELDWEVLSLVQDRTGTVSLWLLKRQVTSPLRLA